MKNNKIKFKRHTNYTSSRQVIILNLFVVALAECVDVYHKQTNTHTYVSQQTEWGDCIKDM